MVKIKPITIKIDDKVWNDFKILIPRTIKLNDAVVKLITAYVKKKKK